MPQTTNDLVNLASLAVTPEMQGNNPKLAKIIFDARMELDRMGKDSSGNPQGGGSTGIPSLYAGPITPATKYPEGYGAFLLNPPAPVRPGSPTQPGFPDKDGDGVDDRYQPGPGLPRPGIENVGLGIGSPKIPGDKMNIPAAFDYASIAPQFTGPSYTNQGVSPAFLENLRRFYG